MITKRTVFVLGAGANVPYGFSTGGGLIDKVRGVDPQLLMGNAGRQVTGMEAHSFSAAVADNLLPSIDAMLEHRTDLIRVGKRVMATLLYQQEARAAPRAFDEDWMSLIFTLMAEGAPSLEAFVQNPVSFVTFNYDRYLEHRFIRGLVARYRVDGQAAWAQIAPMFVHLYGTLGALPEQAPAGTAGVVPLGAPDTPDTYTLGLALPVAETAIRIVHESENLPPSFAESLQRFQSAQQAFFLGFGFGRKNVQRLQTDRIDKNVYVNFTTYDMTAAELHDGVFPAFPNHQLAEIRRAGPSGTRSIRLFLREHILLFR